MGSFWYKYKVVICSMVIFAKVYDKRGNMMKLPLQIEFVAILYSQEQVIILVLALDVTNGKTAFTR